MNLSIPLREFVSPLVCLLASQVHASAQALREDGVDPTPARLALELADAIVASMRRAVPGFDTMLEASALLDALDTLDASVEDTPRG